MVRVAIFGASGDFGIALANEGRKRLVEMKCFARNPIQNHSESVQEFNDTEKFDKYIFTFGSFEVLPFCESNDTNLREALEDNLISIASIIRKILISRRNEISQGIRLDFFVMGSTSAYEGFANTTHYCAAKFALRGLLEALNKEYATNQVRFCLFSTGTMRSKMAKKLPKQDEKTFLDPKKIAVQLFDLVEKNDESFQYEVTIRRRFVR
jgi:short-subunit dehydrogenase